MLDQRAKSSRPLTPSRVFNNLTALFLHFPFLWDGPSLGATRPAPMPILYFQRVDGFVPVFFPL
jgi:hypothetical protein